MFDAASPTPLYPPVNGAGAARAAASDCRGNGGGRQFCCAPCGGIPTSRCLCFRQSSDCQELGLTAVVVLTFFRALPRRDLDNQLDGNSVLLLYCTAFYCCTRLLGLEEHMVRFCLTRWRENAAKPANLSDSSRLIMDLA